MLVFRCLLGNTPGKNSYVKDGKEAGLGRREFEPWDLFHSLRHPTGNSGAKIFLQIDVGLWYLPLIRCGMHTAGVWSEGGSSPQFEASPEGNDSTPKSWGKSFLEDGHGKRNLLPSHLTSLSFSFLVRTLKTEWSNECNSDSIMLRTF